MDGRDVYIGFQFTMPDLWYGHGRGKVCTVIEITTDEIYWNIEGGSGEYYDEFSGMYYDDSILIEGWSDWFRGSKGRPYLPEPSWEV